MYVRDYMSACFAYTASKEIWCLPCKQRMVSVSADFGGKQSHKIGPSYFNPHLGPSFIVLLYSTSKDSALTEAVTLWSNEICKHQI